MAYLRDPVRREGGISLAVKEMREERSWFSSPTEKKPIVLNVFNSNLKTANFRGVY